MFDLKYISKSKKGLNRERNQDKIFILENKKYYLFILFDGVSSYPLSYKFINEFKKEIKLKVLNNINDFNFSNLFFETNNKVLRLGINGMSTMSALIFDKFKSEISFINVGDSRIYIFSNHYLEKITVDDSLKGNRNIITKCLGLESLDISDFSMNTVEIRNNFLICSDGFYELMENNLKDYFETLNFKNYGNIEKKLSLLQRRKNNDDSSYIIVKNEV